MGRPGSRVEFCRSPFGSLTSTLAGLTTAGTQPFGFQNAGYHDNGFDNSGATTPVPPRWGLRLGLDEHGAFNPGGTSRRGTTGAYAGESTGNVGFSASDTPQHLALETRGTPEPAWATRAA